MGACTTCLAPVPAAATLPAASPLPELQNNFMGACYRGDLAAALACLRSGASVNAGSDPTLTDRPLHAAVCSKHYALVLHLLAHGADVAVPGLLALATFCNAVNVVQLLIDAGADVNLADDRDRLPRVAFLRLQHCAVFEALLSMPALDITTPDQRGRTCEEDAVEGEYAVAAVAIAKEVRTHDHHRP